jgi:hypothetical protein
MSDDRLLYLPWYEATAEGLDELAQIKRVVDQLVATQGEPAPLDAAA